MLCFQSVRRRFLHYRRVLEVSVLKRQSNRPTSPVLFTLALFAAASTLSACGAGLTSPADPGRPSALAYAEADSDADFDADPGRDGDSPPSGGVAAACVLSAAGNTYAFVPAFSASDANGYPDSLARSRSDGHHARRTRRSAAQLPRRYHRIESNAQRGGHRLLTTAGAACPRSSRTPRHRPNVPHSSFTRPCTSRATARTTR